MQNEITDNLGTSSEGLLCSERVRDCRVGEWEGMLEVKGARFTPSSDRTFFFFSDRTLKLGQATEVRAISGLLGKAYRQSDGGVHVQRLRQLHDF